MSTSPLVEGGIVTALFAGYVGLWRFKRARDTRRTGVDPEVLARAATPMQAYFARLVWFMTALVVAVICLHTFGPSTWPPLSRVHALSSGIVDLAGGILGVCGLGLCAVAQTTMGASWRVGIDTDRRTELITRGVYTRIRNPTYLGLHVLNLGLWLIWPTTLVGSYIVLFFVVMDIQVRAEEEHLTKAHGDVYRAYVGKSWRYLPWVY